MQMMFPDYIGTAPLIPRPYDPVFCTASHGWINCTTIQPLVLDLDPPYLEVHGELKRGSGQGLVEETQVDHWQSPRGWLDQTSRVGDG